MTTEQLISLITLATMVITPLVGVVVGVCKLIAGQKCLLRSEMLRIYYNHQKEKTIRQFEFENFFALYSAYKSLHGNSFIDKVKAEIQSWTVVS
jgi:hypothetical protein